MKRYYLLFYFLLPILTYSQVNLTQGLKAYYPFSGNSNDESGNSNNPVFNNATLTADRHGNPNSAYHFNGTDNYMKVLNSPSLNMTNQMSISLWMKATGYYTGPCYNNMLVMKSDNDYLPGNYFLRFSDAYTGCTNPTIAAERIYGPGVISQLPLVQLNQWYAVVWTYDGNKAKLYIDCVLQDSAVVSITSFTNAYDLYIGHLNNAQYPYWFNGDLDEVRIYDRALNPEEVNVLSGCNSISSCNNWLNTTASNAYFGVGDLDIQGNQITVEALINRTQPYLPGGGNDTEGDIVSKHTDFNDVNYLLRPNHAYITTTNGFFGTPDVCELELNKTYHVAMVYNGSTLKFYRNGFLMSQINATGNLIQNNLNTQIGHYAATIWNTQFLGFINEVRIWNVARTQSQIQTYMNSSLPLPTTQPGLQAYYTFDNLLNKQGNAAWNGTLTGAASINNTNTSCSFIPDSCATIITSPSISGIINAYTPVLALNPCDNKITVENATAYNTGDTVLMIQMKGAIIDMTNTSSFGNITDYKNSGNYEFNFVKSKSGNIIELKNKITRSYDIPAGKVQLVRVPYYNSITVSDTLTCLPWDGSKGGILVLNVRDTLELNADINTSGKGFLKGIMHNSNSNTFSCGVSGYFFPDNTINAAGKGEGICFLNISQNSGNGPAANGGGGGMNTNSGGGGGSNGNKGGRGGYEWNGGCPNYLTSGNWGLPGNVLLYNNANNKIFMGGAGGAGHCNNQYDGPTENADFNGGNGGAIIIINSDFLKNNNKKIISKGDSAYELNITNSYVTHDGMGGGGAGGTILLNNNNYINNLFVDVSGGKGGNLVAPVAAPGYVGPGGGGGGGVIWVKQNVLPPNLIITNNGGNAGVIVQAGNINYGSAPGLPGINVFALTIPVDTVLFKPNIDSVRIKDSSTACQAFDFNGFGYTNTNPIAAWNWYFGDGGTANTQNTSHTYTNAGTYLVKLVVTDINGCKDSITRNVISNTISVNAGTDSSFCGGPISVQLNGSTTGTGTYSWTPAVYLNNSSVTNPVATVNSTTTFYLTVTDINGCNGLDSVTIILNPVPDVQSISDPVICLSDTLFLTTTGASTYLWQPGNMVSNPSSSAPVFTGSSSAVLIVTGTNTFGCSDTDTVRITLKPNPVVISISDTTICGSQPVTLFTSGAAAYSWIPSSGLNNPNIQNPIFTGNNSQVYIVTGTDVNGCKARDTVSISVKSKDFFVAPPDKQFCKNGSVLLNGNNGNGFQYLWSPSDHLSNPAIINPLATPAGSTVYTVTITDNICNYDSSFQVSVTMLPLPDVQAVSLNDIFCTIKTAQLNASGADQYSWYPASFLSNASISNPVANPVSNTTYYVTGTDIAGCKNTDSVKVLVKNDIERYAIPNSFTPNNDGNNECFGIKHWGDAQNVIFIIYNRYGEKVFETNNINICWDGKYKGKNSQTGNYVYFISALTPCGQIVQKGNVVLFR